jgi:HlyD family secretion protein
MALTGCKQLADVQEGTSLAEASPIVANTAVMAEGRLVPWRSADLAFLTGGRVADIRVQEGHAVEKGTALIVLDDAQQRAGVGGAQAALEAARADLARLEAGARPEEIASYEAAVAVARASASVARGQVESARKSVTLADSTVRQAQMALNDLWAGPRPEELEIARQAVEIARNDLWGAQAARDAVGGAVQRGQASAGDLGRAEALVGVASAALIIAQQELALVEAGPRQGMVDGARVGVSIAEAQKDQTESQLAVAESQVEVADQVVRQTQAQADLATAQPLQANLDRAQAAVAQAEAALRAARASLEQTSLIAPLAGTVAAVEVEVGEGVSPGFPILRLGDFSKWVVETDDLTEIEVVNLSVGQTVTLEADSLPTVTMTGSVESIRLVSEVKRGDTTYTVRIAVDDADPRLRWGMTVVVTFGQ